MAAAGVVVYRSPATQARRSFASASTSAAHKHSSTTNLDSRSQSWFQGRPMRLSSRRPPPSPESRPAGAATSVAFLGTVTADEHEDDVEKESTAGGDDDNVVASSSEFLETVNAVVADVIDGQKFLKETGRTRPRPMKRRALVVCLALGAIRPYVDDVESRVANLRRTSSSSFARTCRLVSQLSFGASRAMASGNYIAGDPKRQTAQSDVDVDAHHIPATTSQ